MPFMGVSRRRIVCGLGTAGVACVVVSLAPPVRSRFRRRATVAERVAEYGPAARARLEPHFWAAGVAYPPSRVVLLGLKQERRLELYAGGAGDGPVFIRAWPIIGASGKLGPKLREGDRQVPEGLYRIDSLNPNSRFHLSLRIDYPNEFDRRIAAAERRGNLGGDIFIHGGSASVGCLAMSDPVAEELFTLVADIGRENVEVVIVPVDLRRSAVPPELHTGWRVELYDALSRRLAALPRPAPGSAAR